MTDRIFTEVNDNFGVNVSIHTTTGISSLDLDPTAAYCIAQYIEWLTETTPEDGVRRPEPTNPAPPGTGVWGEFRPGSKVASAVHIAIIGDDDDSEFGRPIELSPPVATVFANKLIANAVFVVDFDDDEVTE